MARRSRERTSVDYTLPIFQLRITLDDIEPPIWRRVQTHDCALDELHDIIQTVFEWEDGHPHEFRVGGHTYKYDTLTSGRGYRDSRFMRLSKVVQEGLNRFEYEYDFGDSWNHTVEIEATLAAESGVLYPRCIEGQRAGPPEDCGGAYRYGHLVELFRHPDQYEDKEALEWLGKDFDPEKLDLDQKNSRLRHLRRWLGHRRGKYLPQSQFDDGDLVRVKPGVRHSDYPDIPLGGWVGTVAETAWLVPIGYEIRWTDETLQAMHPVYRKRCERDGRPLTLHWVTEPDLELHPGTGPLAIEQPTVLVSRPLSDDNANDRIRMVFGLTSDDPLPAVEETTLRHYREHLAARLQFPFEADHWSEAAIDANSPDKVTVLGFAESPPDEADEGLACRVAKDGQEYQAWLHDLMAEVESATYQLVDDHRHWMWADEEDSEFDDEDEFDENELDEEYGNDEYSDDEPDDEDWDEDEYEDWEDEESDYEAAEDDDFDEGPPEPQKPVRIETPRVGRNDACPCGSGKKYKKCCMRKDG